MSSILDTTRLDSHDILGYLNILDSLDILDSFDILNRVCVFDSLDILNSLDIIDRLDTLNGRYIFDNLDIIDRLSVLQNIRLSWYVWQSRYAKFLIFVFILLVSELNINIYTVNYSYLDIMMQENGQFIWTRTVQLGTVQLA